MVLIKSWNYVIGIPDYCYVLLFFALTVCVCVCLSMRVREKERESDAKGLKMSPLGDIIVLLHL